MSGIAGTVMQGMAFGAGSEVAHRVVGGMMGGSGHAEQGQEQVQEVNQGYTQQQSNPCEYQNTQFIDCLRQSSNDVSACQSYMDMLKQCESQYNPGY